MTYQARLQEYDTSQFDRRTCAGSWADDASHPQAEAHRIPSDGGSVEGNEPPDYLVSRPPPPASSLKSFPCTSLRAYRTTQRQRHLIPPPQIRHSQTPYCAFGSR
ncbi:hypothetical protein BD779DRAFT_626975 [Infundibulicybe gibba]|nr:hypothetical protein BD779DRAFT_626975 [Infundibulicybe gibba]